MPPITPSEMGDSWPAVQPGSDPGDYGSAVLVPDTPCEIRSFQTLRVIYTVGRFGLDDTGAIRIAFRWVNDCGPLQCTDPAAMNHVTATASNGVPLTLYAEPYGYRPWGYAVRITVTGGFMREGDTITVIFGDRSRGSPGFRMQTIAESAFEFRVSVDACATGFFEPLADLLHLPIVAGMPVRWVVVAPGLRRPGEPFAIGIRAEDVWGNVARPGAREFTLVPDGLVAGLPERISWPDGQEAMRVEGLSVPEDGVVRIRLLEDGAERAVSNPVVARDGDLAGYWGDLHGQSGETVGIGTIDEYLAFARDLAFLDVTGHQGNDFQITNAFWDHINRVTTEMDTDGRFVVYPGYEWSGNTPVGGDHNVFFRHAGRQIRRSSHAQLVDRSDVATDAHTLDALFAALEGEDCVVWSHVGGRPADVAYAHDPVLKTAVEVHSNWGTFEWILTDSLALGHRVGVVSNSDGHKGRPGAGPPGATEFGAYGGLTCFLAPRLTREAIFECMRRRHHYGTSGSRIGLAVQARFAGGAQLYTRDPRYADIPSVATTDAMMGDIVEVSENALTLVLRVDAPAPIERVDILRGAELIETVRTYDAEALGNRVRVYWSGAEYRGRGRNTHWQGEIRAEGAGIRGMTPVNHWNLERELALGPDGVVRFDAVTSGNFAGVDLRLEGAGLLNVLSNLVSGSVDIAALGLDDAVLDAGGLERRITVRRVPQDLSDCTMDRTVEVPLVAGQDNPVWVRVTTLDGHQAWSSPIYALRA